MSSSAAAAAAAVASTPTIPCLSDPASWDRWFEQTKSSVLGYLWEYFDPEDNVRFLRPTAPAIPVIEPSSTPVPIIAGPTTRSSSSQPGSSASQPTVQGETSEQQNAREARHEKRLELYARLHTIYRDQKKDWENFKAEETKLRKQILNTVARHRATKLRADLPVRTWLRELKETLEPPLSTTQRSIRIDYQRFMGLGHKVIVGVEATAAAAAAALDDILTDVKDEWRRRRFLRTED